MLTGPLVENSGKNPEELVNIFEKYPVKLPDFHKNGRQHWRTFPKKFSFAADDIGKQSAQQLIILKKIAGFLTTAPAP
jgi:hypothetical protein